MTPTPFLVALAASAALLAVPAQARTPAPPCANSSRACLEKVGRLYIDALLSHDGSNLPLAADVRRSENALTNARGAAEIRESFAHTGMVKAVREAHAYADPSKNEVVYFFVADINLGQKDVSADGTTRAGANDYKTAVTVPPGTYTVHEAERFKIVRGVIHEIEIIAHVENGVGLGSGWPVGRDAAVKK